MRTRRILTTTLLSVALAGCGAGGPAQVQPSRTPTVPEVKETFTPSENPLQSDTPEAADMPPNPPPVEKFIDLSKRDLAKRLTVNESQIEVLQTEEIVWPDSALGCPSPGMVYAQGRVPGYRIWLKASGMEYDYHTDLQGTVILCPPQDPAAGNSGNSSGPTPNIGVPID
jgi:hypothetical protein